MIVVAMSTAPLSLLARTRDRRRRALWAVIGILTAVVLGFFVVRVLTDVPQLASGVVPQPPAFERRYLQHPVPIYVHVLLGTAFLLGAPLQLARRFRAGHLARHRRLGRVLLSAGLVSGLSALLVGLWFPYGGVLEATATVVFGCWFVIALVLAFHAVRTRDVPAHRRYMIRAFAVALGIGTIRVWAGIFQLGGLLAIQDGTGSTWFGVAFWLGLGLHALAAEAYLHRRGGRIPRAADHRGAALPAVGDRRPARRDGPHPQRPATVQLTARGRGPRPVTVPTSTYTRIHRAPPRPGCVTGPEHHSAAVPAIGVTERFIGGSTIDQHRVPKGRQRP